MKPQLTVNRRELLASVALVGSSAAVPASAKAKHDAQAHASTWSARYTAMKGSIPIALYRKRAKAPGGTTAPVLVLCHGSTFTAQTSFDLTVPGAGEYSIMDIFARQGFDVWALDFEGYGRSGSSGGNSDIEASVADLQAMVAVIQHETGLSRFHFWGQSSGALRIGVFAMRNPQHVDRLIFEAPTYTGEGSPTLIERRKRVDEYRANPRRSRDAAAIRNVFVRDHEGATDPRVIAAVTAAELPLGDSVPSGTYLDMSTKLPLVEPKKIQAPVLIARGEWDGIATDDDVLNMFRLLPNMDKMLLMISETPHGIALTLKREVFFRAISAFLPRPV